MKKSPWLRCQNENHAKQISLFSDEIGLRKPRHSEKHFRQKTVYLNTSISDEIGLRKPRHSENHFHQKTVYLQTS